MKLTYPALLLVLTVLVSCQKEYSEDLDDPPVPPPSSAKIKTYTEDVTLSGGEHSVTTFNVYYDDQNRLNLLQSTANPGDKFVYDYPDASTFTMGIFSSNTLIIHADGYLNPDKLVDSIVQYNDEGDTSVQTFVYNNAKQLIAQLEYDKTPEGLELWNTTSYTYDNQGNVLTEADIFGTTTFSYDIVVPNTVSIAPPAMYVPKQLPTKQVYNSGGENYTVDHTYQFDADNRLTEDKGVGSNGDIVIKSYTYY